jgi:hypothetical protein
MPEEVFITLRMCVMALEPFNGVLHKRLLPAVHNSIVTTVLFDA